MIASKKRSVLGNLCLILIYRQKEKKTIIECLKDFWKSSWNELW